MNMLKRRFILRMVAAGGLGLGFGWFILHYLAGRPPIIDFDYQKDHKALQEMFARDWDLLIPVGPEKYSLDLVLKYRAPRQDPWYAGRLILKVMKDGERMIGFVGYYMQNDHEGFLNFLDVNPDYRGQGYAEKLVRYAIDDMVNRGAQRITLVTYPHNIRALKLYTRIGFKEIRRNSQVELEYQVN